MTCKSYCLHAGTTGPSEGDGYLYAPLKGDKAAIIQAIIRNYQSKQSIPQTTVQLLIWAVLAKTSFKNLSPNLQIASVQLLSPQQLLELNGGALGLIPEPVLNAAIAALPAPVQQAITAENNMRQLFANTNATYQDFERIAIVNSNGANTTSYPSGQWSKQPDGYYVRYFPNSYSSTRVQVYIPGATATTTHSGSNGGYSTYLVPHIFALIHYDATKNVAVPANTSSQRLQQSNDDAGNDDAGNNDEGPNNDFDPCKKIDKNDTSETNSHTGLEPQYLPLLKIEKDIATNKHWVPNSTGFGTPDEAAEAAIFFIDLTSVEQSTEYAGNIYSKNGKYYFSQPVATTEDKQNSSQPSDSPIPAGSTLVGVYHTHGGQFAQSDEYFSPQDLIKDAAPPQRLAYLGTPEGKVEKFTPSYDVNSQCTVTGGRGNIQVLINGITDVMLK